MKAEVLLTSSVPASFRAPGTGESRCADSAPDFQADRNVIVWSTQTPSSATRVCGPLSVRAVWGGAEIVTIGRRTLRVDEDSYLVINGGREYSVRSDRRDTGYSVTIFFAHETPRTSETHESVFAEHLRPRDQVTQYLQRILEARRQGIVDNRWYSDQIRMLYEQLVASDDELHRKSAAFAPAGLSTRTELFRRVMTATDFVNSNYMSAVTLDDIASAAHLSKYHLARLFRALHGVSPAAYLRLKRIRTAERLIERSNADLADIAERAGFGSRWSMFRELRRRRGMSGRRIRESWMRSASTVASAV